MMQRIVLPLDGSSLAESVLPHAAAMARATRAELVLLHVLEPSTGTDEAVATDPLNWHLLKAEAQAYLEEVSGQFHQIDLPVTTLLLEGQAAEQIVEFARKEQVDLILLSSHGKSGLSGWNVSSVVQKIILRANTSIMIVRAYHATPAMLGELQYRRILVPLDGSKRAEVVLPVVRELSEEYAAESLLVNIVARPEMPRQAPLTPEDAALADEVVARNTEEAEKYLAQLESRLGDEVKTQLLVGDSVIAVLHEFVESESVDLIVFSAHGYSGDGSRPYGSLVTSFIAYGSTPLLIIQDLPPDEIEQTEAEVVAAQTGKSDSGKGGRRVVHARTA